MDEVFPVLGGIVLGLVFAGRLKSLLARAVFASLILIIAITASAISDELTVSWWFIGVDLIEVAGGALLMTWAFPRLSRMRKRRRLS
ncbi:MAG TPA: hypothetical protein VMT54_05415 [Candidatus Cybelea sp.]|nr:hypothetical protein [Candidatus Cybelea sp.]